MPFSLLSRQGERERYLCENKFHTEYNVKVFHITTSRNILFYIMETFSFPKQRMYNEVLLFPWITQEFLSYFSIEICQYVVVFLYYMIAEFH